MPKEGRDFDIVVWGASGFTGKLTVEYLLSRYGASGDLRWALGGRNPSKLEAVRDELGRETGVDASTLPILVGDGDDESFLSQLAERTRVVCSTVGPYAKYGSKLVAAVTTDVNCRRTTTVCQAQLVSGQASLFALVTSRVAATRSISLHGKFEKVRLTKSTDRGSDFCYRACPHALWSSWIQTIARHAIQSRVSPPAPLS